MQEKIIILDFGSQYTQLIARRLRELNTYCEILPYNKFPYGEEGITVIASPCDIHTVEFSRTPRMRGSFSSCQAKLARPYSRVSADSTFPPDV